MSDLIERLRDYPNNRGHMFMREAAAAALEQKDKRIAELEAVMEAAGEYLYDTSKRQGLQDAYIVASKDIT